MNRPRSAALRAAGWILLLGLATPVPDAWAADWLVSGSARTDLLYFQDPPASQAILGLEDGATNLDGWYDLRVFFPNGDASVRLRVHESSGIADDPSREELDRRHLTYGTSDLRITAGNYYETFGNGIVLRTLEQRFVSLNRVDRAFNLDRNLDGVRIAGDAGPVRATLVSGTPGRQEISNVGGATGARSGDLIQGAQIVAAPVPELEIGLAYVLSDPEGDLLASEDLSSYRLRGLRGNWLGEIEYAELRPRSSGPRGIARYGRLEGSVGRFGVSLEAKSYRDFLFEQAQPPTLVRTHESVLLNRGTHVLLPDDEWGLQTEVLFAPGLFSTVLLNLATADDHAGTGEREFREVYLEGRSEIDGVGAGRLGLDWSRDRLQGIEDRWTAALELERFQGDGSVVLDLELQAATVFGRDVTQQLLQIGYSRAGAWSLTLTGEHSTDRSLERRSWAFATVDVRLSDQHDLTVGYGSRPEGIVCSGGFCFFAPEFEGAELRLLSRF